MLKFVRVLLLVCFIDEVISVPNFLGQTLLDSEETAFADQGRPVQSSNEFAYDQLFHDNLTQLQSPWLSNERSAFLFQLQEDSKLLDTYEHSEAFLRTARIARCKAFCLSRYDTTVGKLRSERGFLIPSICGASADCNICEKACDSSLQHCETHCTGYNQTLIECSVCAFIREMNTNNEEVVTHSLHKKQLIVDRPRAICLTFVGRAVHGFTFKWLLFNMSSNSYVPSSVAVVFLIEHRSLFINGTISSWRVMGTRAEGLIPIRTEPGTSNQYRVTPFLKDGMLTSRMSHWTEASFKQEEFDVPTNVQIIRQIGHQNKVRTTVAINHNSIPSCHYSMNVLPDHEEAHAVHIRRSEAYDLFQNDFYGLDFSTNYSLIIRSTDSSGHTQSKAAYTRWFETASCLSISGNNFTQCASGPPNLLTAARIPSGLRIRWFPPLHTNRTNQLTNYQILVVKTVPMSHATLSPLPGRISLTVDFSTTSVDISNLEDNTEYRIQVRAKSIGGLSTPAEVNIFLEATHVIRNTLYGSLGIFVIVAIGILFKLNWDRYRQNAKELDTIESFIAEGREKQNYFPEYVEEQMRKAIGQMRSIKSPIQSPIQPVMRTLPVQTDQENPLYEKMIEHETDEYEIKFSDIEVGRILGSGAFGLVYEARRKNNGVIYAMKTLKENSTEECAVNLAKELELLILVGSHPNIVNLEGYSMMRGNLCILVEYCSLGDLKTFLEEQRKAISPQLSAKTITSCNLYNKTLNFSRQIAAGMDYLTSRRVVHRDLAARNILLQEENKIKITDFGLSRDTYNEGVYRKTTSGKLPVRWMALESLLYEAYSQQSDVWSFGVVLWEMATLGEIPYCTMTYEELLIHLRKGGRLPRPDGCSQELYDIMSSCWNKHAISRPTFKQLNMIFDQMQTREKANDYFEFSEQVETVVDSGDSGVVENYIKLSCL